MIPDRLSKSMVFVTEDAEGLVWTEPGGDLLADDVGAGRQVQGN